MTRHLLSRTIVGAAGALLTIIGASMLADPQGFGGNNGITSNIDASLASELRAPSGLLIGSGLTMLTSVCRERLLKPALCMAASIYGSYGISRLIGIALDGLPSETLTQAMGLELVFSVSCTAAAYRLHVADRQTDTTGRLKEICHD